MDKPVIGMGSSVAPSMTNLVLSQPASNMARASQAVSNLSNLIRTGSFSRETNGLLMKHLTNAQSILRKYSGGSAAMIHGGPSRGINTHRGMVESHYRDGGDVFVHYHTRRVSGESTGDDSSDSSTLDDIESAVETAADVYQTVTNKPAPVVVTKIITPPAATATTIMGMPPAVVVVGGGLLGLGILYAIFR
jgi:hypothetical protein